MGIKFDFNNMTDAVIGQQQGISASDLQAISQKISQARQFVVDNLGKGWQEWSDLPAINKDALNEILQCGKQIKKSCESFVVLGIGGSALGPQSVLSALLHLRHNELKRKERKAPKFYIEDNIDPERMAALLDVIDMDKTVFNVITKSGETSETLSQFLILYDILKSRLGENAKQKIIVTTTIGKGSLYEIAQKEGFKTFPIGQGVGGRFSVLSAVGLLPFAVMGVDVKKLLKGAGEMGRKCQVKDLYKNPALLSATLQYISQQRGKNISVLMPYADSLKYMADFYCQLWGESLGKAYDYEGKLVNVGQTPVKTLGVTDQHSQIQLFVEGPYDKVVTFLGVDKFRKEVNIPKMQGTDKIAFLQGHSLNELINAERVATEFALTKAQRANFSITLDEVNAQTVGALLAYLMYQTAYCGALLNIDTFNQPGVEEGKKATFAMLGRKGYEQKLEEIQSSPKDDKWIIQ